MIDPIRKSNNFHVKKLFEFHLQDVNYIKITIKGPFGLCYKALAFFGSGLLQIPYFATFLPILDLSTAPRTKAVHVFGVCYGAKLIFC